MSGLIRKRWALLWFARCDYAAGYLNDLEEKFKNVKVESLRHEGERVLLLVSYVE